ncbi:MAG: hypothetical protein LBS83_00200 [Holosporales bacterium]|jgi:hypothetical protein|nr:hypothetical protein [Holosporales bacterium]
MKKLLLTLSCAAVALSNFCFAEETIFQEEELCTETNNNVHYICLETCDIDTNPCLKRLNDWKREQDRYFLICCSWINITLPDFISKEEVEFLHTVRDSQNNFYENAFKILALEQERRDESWYNIYLKEISRINDIIAQHSIAPICSTLEYKASISQRVGQLEKMIENGDISSIKFCKECWQIYTETGIEVLQSFIEKYSERLSEEEKAELDLFKEERKPLFVNL